MPLYRIDRYMGDATPAELEAAIFRALACIPNFEGMRWVRSYYDEAAKRSACFFEARNAEDLRLHAQWARVPCDAIAEVRELLPEHFH
jgi:hypothetical protein